MLLQCLMLVILAVAQAEKDIFCSEDGMDDFNIEKHVTKDWYLAYVYPEEPKISFWLMDTCINISMTLYPDRHAVGFRLRGNNIDTGDMDKGREMNYYNGSKLYGEIDGYKQVIIYYGDDYENWAFGTSCVFNDHLAAEYWWVLTSSPRGDFGTAESTANFKAAVEEAGFSDYFTPESSTNLSQCEY